MKTLFRAAFTPGHGRPSQRVSIVQYKDGMYRYTYFKDGVAVETHTQQLDLYTLVDYAKQEIARWTP